MYSNPLITIKLGSPISGYPDLSCFSGYPSGFNGKENDNEIKGVGNSLDFGARFYDSRLGRFLSIDSKFKSYPSHSSYCAFNNNPMFFVDPSGNDGIAYWDYTEKRKTLVIKADYHYIKGQFEENVLAAVQKEYGSFKKINYYGEIINVRFEIGFHVHNEGSDLSTYDGNDGQNRLIKESIPQSEVLELSYYQQVGVDDDKIKSSSVKTPDGNTVSLNSNDKLLKQVSTISHGIGHNIGLIHDDEGIMLNQRTIIYKETDLFDAGKITYRPVFNPNHISITNIQNLSYRIGDMTKQGRGYWKDKRDKVGDDLKDYGITKLKESIK